MAVFDYQVEYLDFFYSL